MNVNREPLDFRLVRELMLAEAPLDDGTSRRRRC
jgi:hypothetical protein